MNAASTAVLLLALGACAPATPCDPVAAAYDRATSRLGCTSLPPTLDGCAAYDPATCTGTSYERERAAGLPWRSTPADAVRVLDAARTCGDVAIDVGTWCPGWS